MNSKPTMWQKLNGASVPRKCDKGEIEPELKKAYYCEKNAMFRTKLEVKQDEPQNQYTYRCAEHTYLFKGGGIWNIKWLK